MPLSQFLLNEVTADHDMATPEGRAHAQFDAKPLLQAMPPSALRLQIVRGLAQLTQTAPAEIETLFALKQPVTRVRQAPPRSARTQPVGLGRQVLHLLVAHPLLAGELDQAAIESIVQVAPDCADMLYQLINASREMGSDATFAALAEHLRTSGTDFEPVIVEIAAMPETEIDVARLELAGAIRQSRMKLLTAELSQLAAAGLGTKEAEMRYRELMFQQDQLRRQASEEKAKP
jgi:DNA primase